MYTYCPSCHSTNIKKNGKTYYGKQNHCCKCCGRQFVLNNKHTKTEALKDLLCKCLKERLSLRAICRVFDISLTWLTSFAQIQWSSTPKDLGISLPMLQRIKRLQVFGIQMDELWSFVGKRTRKRWIWVVYDPVHRLVIAQHIGGRGKRDAKKLWKKVPSCLKDCMFETDNWKAYEAILAQKQHRVGKDLTYYIEGFNATIRARVSRLVRKTLSFSKLDKWHNLAIAWFFWQFNLEQLE